MLTQAYNISRLYFGGRGEAETYEIIIEKRISVTVFS